MRGRVVVTLFAILAVMAAAGCGKRMGETRTREATPIDARREAFRKAYNAGDTAEGVKQLCDLLHEKVSFRGKFQQGQWTRQRDNLIKRWRRDQSVDCKNPQGKTVGIRVIGANEIVIRSSETIVGTDTVLDYGTFDMRPVNPEGQQFEVLNNRYMMIWVKDEADRWALKYIDMDP